MKLLEKDEAFTFETLSQFWLFTKRKLAQNSAHLSQIWLQKNPFGESVGEKRKKIPGEPLYC